MQDDAATTARALPDKTTTAPLWRTIPPMKYSAGKMQSRIGSPGVRGLPEPRFDG
jgi:hypothetical protein